jgi:hypothetical protein
VDRSQKFERAAQIVGTEAREEGKLFADFLSNSWNSVGEHAPKAMAPTMLLLPSCITKGTPYFFHIMKRPTRRYEHFHGKKTPSPIIASLDSQLDFCRSIVRSVGVLYSMISFDGRLSRSLDLFVTQIPDFPTKKLSRKK